MTINLVVRQIEKEREKERMLKTVDGLVSEIQ